MLKHYHQLIYLILIMLSSVGCDQTSKRLAEHVLQENSYNLFFDTIRLQLIKNTGAFLSFGAHFSESIKLWLFIILPLVVLFFALFFVFSKKLPFVQRLMIALIISGGIGNLIDRIMLSGHVTDFMNIGIGYVRTGIFNFADVVIMGGAIGLFLLELIKNRPVKNS